jgi:hypothetical protein
MTYSVKADEEDVNGRLANSLNDKDLLEGAKSENK